MILPPGRRVELPSRGTTFVRDFAGPAGAATVVLLHGWMATADLNWFTSYAALGQYFRVLALDHRGHGQGIRSRRFRLEDCADDVAALLDVVGVERAVIVGYSMGGPIAQLTWRQHPARVQGLALCATSRTFAGRANESAYFQGMVGSAAALLSLAPMPLRRRLLGEFIDRRPQTGAVPEWMTDQLRKSDPALLAQAGRSLGGFDSRSWIGEVDVPTAVLVTMHDNLVPPARQRSLAESITGAVTFEIDGDHRVCVAHPEKFVPTLVYACQGLARRGRTDSSAGF